MSIARIVADAFRFSGDSLHVASKVVLIAKISKTRSCSGLSLKTQLLYTIVFIARYMDIFDFRIKGLLDLYNLTMKFLFIGFQVLIFYLMRFKYFSTYDRKWDKFNILTLIVPCLVFAYPFAHSVPTVYGRVVKLLYVMSLFLESVAILPQLVQLQEAGESETMTSQYVLLLGLYRAAYTIYFIIKKIHGVKLVGNIPIACGIIQTLLYVDFFVIYYKYVFRKSGVSERLPSSITKTEL